MTTPRFATLLAGVTLTMVTSIAAAQSTVYSTGFEVGDGITVGNLNGQASWVVDSGGTANVAAGAGAGASAQFVQMGANSTISRATASTDDQVIVRASYQGAGSPTLTTPTAGPTAALIGFRTVSGSAIAIAAWDGTTNQWVEPASPVTFSNTDWHEVVVALDYSTKTYNVRVNGANHLQGVCFRDMSVSQLNGIGAGSQTAAKVDSVGLFASGPNGDYDADGWTDKFETAGGNSSPLAGTSTVDYVAGNEPSLGDLNADFNHDAADYALLATNLVNGGATADMNGDGSVNAADVTHYGNRVAGVIAVMR